jgi:hypothetical protein
MSERKQRKKRTRELGDYDPELIRRFKRYASNPANIDFYEAELDEPPPPVDFDGHYHPNGGWFLLPVSMATEILATLERAKMTGGGRRFKSQYDNAQDRMAVSHAEYLRRKLWADGEKKAKKTTERAAEQAKHEYGSTLSRQEIGRRMRVNRRRKKSVPIS